MLDSTPSGRPSRAVRALTLLALAALWTTACSAPGGAPNGDPTAAPPLPAFFRSSGLGAMPLLPSPLSSTAVA